jgi:nucleoside-diphosphate-sugar epimerase
VTGKAGFVGAPFCEALVGEGGEVICIDDVTTEPASHLAQSKDAPGFRMLRHDTIQPFPDDFPRLDEIYNFAGPASPVQRCRKPGISHLCRELDWSPRTPRREGLARTIGSFASHLRIGEPAAVADA